MQLGYRFKNAELLRRALTHPSYVNEHPDSDELDNQRLEFLGDAVLDFVIGEWVFRWYPDFQEGEMTRLRAALVRTESLAQLGSTLGVGQALRLGRGEEEGGGRTRPANLCDAFEALVGAVYLDGGLDPVRELVVPLVEPLAQAIVESALDKDAKSRLQEWAQSETGLTPRYRIVDQWGPDHDRTFVAQVALGDRVLGQGEGHSKQLAEQAAAQNALESITSSITRIEKEQE